MTMQQINDFNLHLFASRRARALAYYVGTPRDSDSAFAALFRQVQAGMVSRATLLDELSYSWSEAERALPWP